jgi:hypothetical protein
VKNAAAALLLLLSLFPGVASAQPAGELTSDLRSEDWAKATDVVILGDGYTATERELFLADAKKLSRRMRVEASARPMREASDFNFHFVFVPGRDKGAPWQPGRPARSTPFRAHVDAAGDFITDDARADSVAAELAPDVDLVVILVRFTAASEVITPRERNRFKKLGRPADGEELDLPESPGDVRPSADWPVDGKRIRITTKDTEAFIHEVGHALYGLSDEYDEFAGTPSAAERWEIAVSPNLTLERTGSRWSDLLGTPPVEGGGTWKKGVWRPQAHCRMRESRSELFCPVCVDVIERAPSVRRPPAPTWVRPTANETVVLAAGERRLVLEPKWRHAGGAHGQAIAFRLDLRRVSPDGSRRRQVWFDEQEGHLRTAPLDVGIRQPGTYCLGLSAKNLAGSSEVVWTTFTVRFAEGDEGIVGSIPD